MKALRLIDIRKIICICAVVLATISLLEKSNTHATSHVNLQLFDNQQSLDAGPGGSVCFAYNLLNTGTDIDTFSLSVAQDGTDDFDLAGIAVLADANDDGVADNALPITSTGALIPAGLFNFMVCGAVPQTALDGDLSALNVTAASGIDANIQGINTADVVVTSGAVLTLRQSISALSGISPSGPYTYTSTYANVTSQAATSFKLTQSLPSGMTYQQNSGQWMPSGSAPLALTDGTGADPVGIDYDYGVTIPDEITATLANVPANQGGIITFAVSINATLPVALSSATEFEYDDAGGGRGPFHSNRSDFTVTAVVTPTPTPTPSPTSGTPTPTPTPTPSPISGTQTPTPMPSPTPVFCNGKKATIVGTFGNDVLRGTSGPDVIYGSDGDDVIHGFGGADRICGGKGRDQLYGGSGNDILYGAKGRDRLDGGKGRDFCHGGRGRDRAIRCERKKSIP